MVYTRYENKLGFVSMWRRPYNHAVSNALATSGKTEPISLFFSMFLRTLSTRRTWVVVQCCVWVRTQTACCGGTRGRLFRLGSWWVGSCQRAYHLCWADLRIEKRSALNPSRVSGWKSLRRISKLVGSTAFGKPRSRTWQGKLWHLVEDALGRNSIYRLVLFFPRTDHQYTRSHSPLRCTYCFHSPITERPVMWSRLINGETVLAHKRHIINE